MIPLNSATSPLMRTVRKRQASFLPGRSSRTGFCGLLKRISPVSIKGLTLGSLQPLPSIAQVALEGKSTVDWQSLIEDYDRIREHIEHVVPGFTQYNARVRQPGGFYLPNKPYEGKFATPSNRAKFTVHGIPEHDLGGEKLLLTTIRSHDQFNTTIYTENDRYRGISHTAARDLPEP
jgi:hypothetical protein